MSRSVSVPCNAVQVAYAVMDGDTDYDEFSFLIEGFQDLAGRKFPSMSPCDWWSQEDHAVMENDLAYFTVSEYNGIVAIAVVPKDLDNGRSVNWANKIKIRSLARCFGDPMRSMGSFSNGEQLFLPVFKAPKKGMGLGYSSNEGWL